MRSPSGVPACHARIAVLGWLPNWRTFCDRRKAAKLANMTTAATQKTLESTTETTAARVADALSGRIPVGSEVIIRGWVRTRRDSKAGGGLSFINVHDGSCFDPIQVVAANTLDNYQSDVLRIT